MKYGIAIKDMRQFFAGHRLPRIVAEVQAGVFVAEPFANEEFQFALIILHSGSNWRDLKLVVMRWEATFILHRDNLNN